MSGVPQFPQTVAGNTVIGRLRADDGEIEVVTFAQLAAALANSLSDGSLPVIAAEVPYPTTGIQYAPQDIDGNCVVGRLSASSGATEQVTFCQLIAALQSTVLALI